VPAGKLVVLTTQDMLKVIHCTGCFREVTFGECYTSRTLHTSLGLGYPVCEDCYNKEWAGEKAAKQ